MFPHPHRPYPTSVSVVAQPRGNYSMKLVPAPWLEGSTPCGPRAGVLVARRPHLAFPVSPRASQGHGPCGFFTCWPTNLTFTVPTMYLWTQNGLTSMDRKNECVCARARAHVHIKGSELLKCVKLTCNYQRHPAAKPPPG